jgi:hypothetical protein
LIEREASRFPGQLVQSDDDVAVLRAFREAAAVPQGDKHE